MIHLKIVDGCQGIDVKASDGLGKERHGSQSSRQSRIFLLDIFQTAKGPSFLAGDAVLDSRKVGNGFAQNGGGPVNPIDILQRALFYFGDAIGDPRDFGKKRA
jgi:hypothetical protein